MKKIYFLLFALFLLNFANAQTITLIPNPNTGIGCNLFGNCPIIYNNNLYFGYQNADSILQLAKYDGTSITLVPNPNAGIGYNGDLIGYFDIESTNGNELPTIYNNNLYFGYQNADSILQLAKYDGTSISLIPNPDAGIGYMSYHPIIYNNNLYFQYVNSSVIYQLAKYDGTSITLIPNPNAGNGFCDGAIIYSNKLYFQYQNQGTSGQSGICQLAKYDGTSITLIPNPDAGFGYNGYGGEPIIYNNNLYFFYLNTHNILQLAKYDGNSITLIPNPDAGNGYDNV